MGKRKMEEALQALSDELAQREIRGQVFVVGGAAMALAYASPRLTSDIDAIFEPKMAIYDAARAVAEREGLPEDWLNDAVKGFAPGPDRESVKILSTPSLEVTAASPQYLLAMKLLASRVGQDLEDIQTLYGLCGFTTADEGLDLLERFYPSRPLQPKTQFLLEELFGRSS